MATTVSISTMVKPSERCREANSQPCFAEWRNGTERFMRFSSPSPGRPFGAGIVDCERLPREISSLGPQGLRTRRKPGRRSRGGCDGDLVVRGNRTRRRQTERGFRRGIAALIEQELLLTLRDIAQVRLGRSAIALADSGLIRRDRDRREDADDRDDDQYLDEGKAARTFPVCR